MSEPITVTADHVIFSFSAKHPPVLEVDSGATLDVETRDSYNRRFLHDPDIHAYLRDLGGHPLNPVTGPIFVRGIEPGDGLDVTIQKIELAETGFVAVVPGIGLVEDSGIEPRLTRFRVRADGLWYEDRIRLPLRPMVGTIGVAPAQGEFMAVELGYHGGNLDCNDITEGTVVHFPVHVPGGGLAVGDVHARMGFGEAYSGVNIDAHVILRLERVAGAGWDRPWLETESEIMAIGVEDQIEDAIYQAVASMTGLLEHRLAAR